MSIVAIHLVIALADVIRVNSIQGDWGGGDACCVSDACECSEVNKSGGCSLANPALQPVEVTAEALGAACDKVRPEVPTTTAGQLLV